MGARAMRVWARVLLTAAAALVAATAVVTPAAADDGQPGSELGVGLWVPILPTHVKTAAPPASGSGATSTGAGAGAAAPSSVVTQTQNTPGSGDMVIAGGLYLGDVSASSRPTLNPFEGRTELWLTLRNLSTDTIDATADFSLATFYGERIDGSRVEITGLKPEETRVVGTMLQGSGQWPFVVGRVTVDPPDTIAGQKTAPVSRATVVYVFPWLLAIALVLVALALVLLKLSASILASAAVPTASTA